MRMFDLSRAVAVANRQFGLITHAQLIALGWSQSQITGAVARGALVREGRGVYSLPGARTGGRGGGPDRASLCRRALLGHFVAGPQSVVSHTTAAGLHGLDGLDGLADTGPIHLTVPAGRSRRPAGFEVHESKALLSRHLVRLHEVIPCTSVVRTLIDLGAVLDADRVERAAESAMRKQLVNMGYLRRHLDLVGRRGRNGAGVLRDLLTTRGDVPATGSDLEVAAIQLFRDEAGIHFERQVEMVPGIFVDLGCRDLLIGCELDGFEFHSTRQQLLRDVERQNRLMVAGVLLLRFGWEHVHFRRYRLAVVETARQAVAARQAGAAGAAGHGRPAAGGGPYW